MNQETISLKKKARFAGFVYLLLAIPAPFALLYIPATLYVRGDAAATIANIQASESLFRAGIVTSLAVHVIFLLVAFAIYRLFEGVNRTQAWLMVAFVVVSAAVGFLNDLHQIAVLILSSGADFLAVFTKPQLDALALFFLRLHSHGIQANSLFWGLWLLPLGFLVYRSRFIPRIFGVLLILNGLAYMLSSVTYFAAPQYVDLVSRITIGPKFAGELPFLLWLLIKGVRTEEIAR